MQLRTYIPQCGSLRVYEDGHLQGDKQEPLNHKQQPYNDKHLKRKKKIKNLIENETLKNFQRLQNFDETKKSLKANCV